MAAPPAPLRDSQTPDLNPTLDQINGHDSYDRSQPASQPQLYDQPSMVTETTQFNEDAISGEKRKREESEDPLPDSGNAVKNPDSPPLHPLWKTSLCSYFRREGGSCSHGGACRYAHSEEELRPRPDNTWDPTSERAKKAMKSSNGDRLAHCATDSAVMMTEDVVDGEDANSDDAPATLDDDNNNHDQLRKCLIHLPRKWGSENLIQFLNEQKVCFKGARKKKGMMVGFVSFADDVQLQSALTELEGKSIGSKNLKVADVIPRSFGKKDDSVVASPKETPKDVDLALTPNEAALSASSDGIVDGDSSSGSFAQDGSTPKTRSVRDVVTPLAHMTYPEQLEHKKNSILQILKKLTRSARKGCPHGVSLPEWILKSREIGGLPCKLEGILGSPAVNGYRNKCEFSVGYSLGGKLTVGFMLGNFREGVTAVEEPIDCPNVSTIACSYASIFQEFLQHSQLPVWNRFKNVGFWRQLMVREGRTNDNGGTEFLGIAEVMLVVQVSSMGHDDALVACEFKKLAHAFAYGAAACTPPLPLTALVVQDHIGVSNVAPTDAPLRVLPLPDAIGNTKAEKKNMEVDARIHDYISNLRFCISPTAFFQVNTLAAEKLYSLAGDWACLGQDTLLFDICCGAGTIGLTLAHRVGMVIGIEMNASAVSDAQKNAEINGIKNCRFVAAKAEDVIGSLLREYLDESQAQADTSVSSGINETEIIADQDKDGTLDSAEGSSNHELENGNRPSGCSESVQQEVHSELQTECSSKNVFTPVHQFQNVVAIVDPPRAGLHPTVIKALRNHPRLRRLVYISCNPETLVANAIELCTPSPMKIEKGNKDNRGWRNMSSAGLARHRVKSMPFSEPFQPVKVMAVDLFPHTQHCEMVMLLER